MVSVVRVCLPDLQGRRFDRVGENAMKVLIACEESQTVCKAFRELGHEAYSCDIQECSGNRPEWHIKGDCVPLLGGHCSFETMDGTKHEITDKWDLIIAHPPCTYISNVGARFLYPGGKGVLNEQRLKKGIEATHFFLRFLYADCERIAIENPIPSKSFKARFDSTPYKNSGLKSGSGA